MVFRYGDLNEVWFDYSGINFHSGVVYWMEFNNWICNNLLSIYCVFYMLCEKYLVHFPAEKLKRDFDKAFGPPWNVVVGECYTCDIDYDFGFLYQFLYGPVAVLAWRVRFFLIKNISTKGHSLYQVSSKMLPGSKVITFI